MQWTGENACRTLSQGRAIIAPRMGTLRTEPSAAMCFGASLGRAADAAKSMRRYEELKAEEDSTDRHPNALETQGK